MTQLPFQFNQNTWQLGLETIIMGIVNVTPDSFSDGGSFANPDTALEHAMTLIQSGAKILDIGGESTRPGAPQVSTEDELNRTIPVIKKIRQLSDIPISIDTTKAEVARQALQAGADIINDISGLHHDPDMLPLLAETNAGCIVMHMRGTPQTMQTLTDYDDLIGDICTYFRQILERAQKAGIAPERFILDPGIGFSKTAQQNLEIIANTPRFRTLGRPILLGPSRKSFIGKLLNQPDPAKRVWGTAGACACGAMLGGDIIRVHDVDEMRQVLTITDAIRSSHPQP